jgi:parallel beta-helix repeat protein
LARVEHKTHIGREDIEYYDGTTTFERLTSTGASNTLNKVGYVIDVLACGINGDGTDEIGEIQTLLNQSGTIVFPKPPTRYSISSALSIPSNTRIILMEGATIKLADSADTHIFQNSDTTDGNSNIYISGPGKIDGNTANQSSNGTAIYFQGVDNFRIDGVEIVDTQGKGIDIGSINATTTLSREGIICNNKINNCTSNSIALVGGSDTDNVNNIGVYNNIIGDGSQTGIILNYALECVVEGNIIDNESNNGINVGVNSYRNLVNGNSCRNCGADGIDLAGNTDNVVTSNVCYNNDLGINFSTNGDGGTIDGNMCISNTRYGINGNLADGLVVANNICGLNGLEGILLNGCNDCIVEGNRCESNGYHGISISSGAGASKHIIVANNICKNNGTDAANTYDGIILTGDPQYVVLAGNICYDDQGTKTQRAGIYSLADTSPNVNCFGNICYGNLATQNIFLVDQATNQVALNIQGTEKMVGTFTCDNDTSTTVNNKNVHTTSQIFLMATDSAGAALTGVYISARVSDTSFTVTHSSAAGTEVFNYLIVD